MKSTLATRPLVYGGFLFSDHYEAVRILHRPLARLPLPMSGFLSSQITILGLYVRIICEKYPASKPKIAQFVRITHPGSPPTFRGPP